MPVDLSRLPAPDVNNVWHDYNPGSDTVLIFVHGVLSDSRSAWFYGKETQPEAAEFWPELLHRDPRIRNVSTYLAGYSSEANSQNYDFDNCADEVFRALKRAQPDGKPSAMSKPRLVFVCHSMGGIVVRYLLEREREAFQDKAVGLMLLASPSMGSEYADRLKFLAAFYKNEQGKNLTWKNNILEDLDGRFKDFIHKKRLPAFIGIEGVEQHFILQPKPGWFPQLGLKPIVSEDSAGRYFGQAKLLPGTDHLSIAKPDSLRHPSHELLIDFLEEFKRLELPPRPGF